MNPRAFTLVLLVAALSVAAWWVLRPGTVPRTDQSAPPSVAASEAPQASPTAETAPPAPLRAVVPPPPSTVVTVSNDTIASPARPTAEKPSAAANSGPLHFTAGPMGGAEMVRNSLQNGPLARMRNAPPELANADALDIRPPLPIYVIGSQSGNLESAQPRNMYYYPVVGATGQVAAIQLMAAPDTGEARVVSEALTTSPQNIAQALAWAEVLPQLRAGSYEARYLNIQIQVARGSTNTYPVLWLKSQNGMPDLLYTMRTYYFSAVEANKLYTYDELIQALKAARPAGQAATSLRQ